MVKSSYKLKLTLLIQVRLYIQIQITFYSRFTSERKLLAISLAIDIFLIKENSK